AASLPRRTAAGGLDRARGNDAAAGRRTAAPLTQVGPTPALHGGRPPDRIASERGPGRGPAADRLPAGAPARADVPGACVPARGGDRDRDAGTGGRGPGAG